MGFWDVAKRMIQGKPAFEVPTDYKKQKEDWGETPREEVEPFSDQSGNRVHRNQRIGQDGQKVQAEAEIVQVKPRYSGAYVELWVTVRNNSTFDIQMDRIQIFGTNQEFEYPLPPGGTRDFMIYSGLQPKTDGYKYAELYYRDRESGDYFCAMHAIEYRYETTGTYEVVEMHIVRPVKDV